jgi:hypothetical protein
MTVLKDEIKSTRQITTFTLFSFNGFGNKYHAFKGMVEFPPQLKSTVGLEFFKLMGVGGKRGFGIFPNLGSYALLCIWKNEDAADLFFENEFSKLQYVNKASGFQTVYLYNIAGHGTWGGLNPFRSVELPWQNKPIAVLTRATIRWKDMIRFWKDVPPVSKSLLSSHAPVFAAGIGEMPFRYQATFSIWPDAHAMKSFAYQDTAHTTMIAKTNRTGWYSESLFARFIPFKCKGINLMNISDIDNIY